MLSAKQKSKIIENFKTNEKDTGSANVQAAILTKQIDELSKHLKKHKKDLHSKRGLLKMVSKRRKMLDYLSKTDEKKYKKVIKELGLKR